MRFEFLSFPDEIKRNEFLYIIRKSLSFFKPNSFKKPGKGGRINLKSLENVSP
jgi:hypothetical protein